ncbi:MAG: phosphoribosylglycinamide formyltransferase [Bacteroidota bacterium]|nr:phosphoribosylglycinamide formyltransferase [Bacteroidota bacterium]MDP4190861.1 phosphoribosylglycinamide formyltransferase [Bacteroidota bacterium]MDP4193898.1 phosphoribosylglycinamide formyltransferase [Bacteroidota bacterium]
MLNLAVFVSGRGSNFQSILEAISSKVLEAQVKSVFTDKESCGAMEIAEKYSIPVYSISNTDKPGFISYKEVSELLLKQQVDLIVLAGFLKKLPDTVVDEYENRIINIHPALLPCFGGKGMYGMNVHRAVFNSSAKVSGATVHFVDKIYDNGKIIAQEAVDISDVGSPEEIAERVLKIEHKLLPFVIKKISEKKVVISENRVIVH